MYTAPEFRGRGVARAVLAALEADAYGAGKRRMVMETGLAQPEAIALYQRCGYERIPNFGYYRESPLCVSFGRSLDAPPADTPAGRPAAHRRSP